MTQGSVLDFSGQDGAYDMTVGNFDHRQPDLLNAGQTQHNFNDQIAVLYGSCGNGTKAVSINNVDPGTFSISAASNTKLPSLTSNWSELSFTQADTQGRSYILGEPTKITIQTLDQPTVIAAAPPMHVDFAQPLDGAADANTMQVLNVSALSRAATTPNMRSRIRTAPNRLILPPPARDGA
ncbi:MAG: hypothetical protein JO185_08945 [Acidobacteriaceae bacterium]|nr:hypothetical protein [Acidobacteriaceae bacterium]